MKGRCSLTRNGPRPSDLIRGRSLLPEARTNRGMAETKGPKAGAAQSRGGATRPSSRSPRAGASIGAPSGPSACLRALSNDAKKACIAGSATCLAATAVVYAYRALSTAAKSGTQAWSLGVGDAMTISLCLVWVELRLGELQVKLHCSSFAA